MLHFGLQIDLCQNPGGLGLPNLFDVQRAIIKEEQEPKFHGLERLGHAARYLEVVEGQELRHSLGGREWDVCVCVCMCVRVRTHSSVVQGDQQIPRGTQLAKAVRPLGPKLGPR